MGNDALFRPPGEVIASRILLATVQGPKKLMTRIAAVAGDEAAW